MRSTTTMRPSKIRYSQDSIAKKFSTGTGKTLLETFEELVNGETNPEDLDCIEVSFHDGGYIAFEGNRRLFLFKVCDIYTTALMPMFHLTRMLGIRIVYCHLPKEK